MKAIILLKAIVFLSITTDAIKYQVTEQVYFKIAIGRRYEGDIVIGLFGNIVPKTVNNFKVIATNGINGKTYNSTRFHRVIKRFMIQGGDIIHNNGSGSWSIYGKYFNDENFHVKHTASGLVSMVNTGPNTNGCQFFITTAPTPWLDSHHTVFAKVLKGQRIVHKIEHVKTDTSDQPLIPIEIIESGLIPEKPFFVEDSFTYSLKDWLSAGFVPLSFSFSILFFFQWVIKKLDGI